MKLRHYWLLAVAVLLAGWAIWRGVQPSLPPPKMLVCPDLHQGCSDEQNDVQIRFVGTPRNMQPFGVVVTMRKASAVFASFAMQGMEMGLNRYRLLRQPDGTWAAEVTLPVCVQGRSDWLMELEVIEPDGAQRYQLAFRAN